MSFVNGDIPRFLANGDGPGRVEVAEACGAVFGPAGTGLRLAERLPTADSLCSLKVARASKISGRKFSAAARRKRTALRSAESVRGDATRRRSALPPRRAPFGRKESPPWAGVPPDAVCPRLPERPYRTPPPPRSAASFPLPSDRAVSPRWKRPQDSLFGFLLSPGVVHSSPSNGKWGPPALGQHAGSMRCRWARLSRVDALCDRMERRRGGSHYGPPRCTSAQPFLQTLRPEGFRRATAENFRPEIFEARATLREQSGSTLGRRVYAQSVPVCQETRNVPISLMSLWDISGAMQARGTGWL